MSETLAAQPLGDLLAGIASDAPAPGAGAGAAAALAIGLACARKALRLTLKHDPRADGLEDLDAHLAGLVEQALAGGEADMACFRAYIAAVQRPRDDEGRAAALAQAQADLVAVGENLLAIGEEARAKLAAVRTDIRPAMAADIGAALVLIAAARGVHAACVAESRGGLNP